jgi:hypothetical protein
LFGSAVNFRSKLQAGMMASRLYHRRHVIPALTDHLEDKGGVIGAASSAPPSNIVNRSYGVLRVFRAAVKLSSRTQMILFVIIFDLAAL